MTRYYDRKGHPLPDTEAWGRLFQDKEYKQVVKTEIGDVLVSTVWLGLDHRFGDGPPLIFETMVFGGPLDQEQERYSTEEAALAGHERLVTRVKEAS